jgi:chromosomal replication initiator protein
MENFWFACLGRFERELSSMQFNTLIKPLKLDDSNDCLRIVAPNRFVMQSIKEKFLDRIHQLGQDFFSRPIVVELVLSADSADQELPAIAPQVAPIQEPQEPPTKKTKSSSRTDASGLNASLTFNNFVTGKANQLARAAALQVAENPGGAYNPLFVYGGVGLGKTHMIQAIGNHLREQRPDAKISYLHAEKYVSDVVKAYQHKAFDDFKKR